MEETNSDGQCVVCKVRKGTTLNKKACRDCSRLTAAEGTRAKYGLPKSRHVTLRRINDIVRIHNKMVSERKTQAEIAAALGMKRQTLRNLIVLLRRDGYHLEASLLQGKRHMEPSAPLERTRGRIPHGGGVMGVPGCNCELCLPVRREYQRRWCEKNPDKVAKYRADQYAKQREQRLKPS